MGIFAAILVLSIIGFILHLFLSHKQKTPKRIVELFLLYQLVFNIGILGFLSFFGLTWMPETVAAHNNWPTCPTQQELGNVNLAFGVLGILCIWMRGLFWSATTIGASIWLFSDGIHHLYDMLVRHNYSEGNTGLLIYSDFAIPIVLIVLLFYYHKLWAKKP